MSLKRGNILVKVNFWVMFTISCANLNAKKIIRQRFEISVWTHVAYTLYLRKAFACLSRANLNSVISSLDNSRSVVHVSYLTFLPMFFTFPRAPYVTQWLQGKNLY